MRLILIIFLLTSNLYAFDIKGYKSGSNIKDFKNITEVTHKQTPMAIEKPDVRYYKVSNFSYLGQETVLAFKKDKLYRIIFNGFGGPDFITIFNYCNVIYGDPVKEIGNEEKKYWEWESEEKDVISLMYLESFAIFIGDVEDPSIE